jgi:hypothetical protein
MGQVACASRYAPRIPLSLPRRRRVTVGPSMQWRASKLHVWAAFSAAWAIARRRSSQPRRC